MKNANPLALVTGASSGIGETFARRLSARGYDLLLVARRRDRLERLAAELGNAEAIAADLTEESDIGEVERRIGEERTLDLLVNNAGFGTSGFFHESDVEGQSRMVRLHVLAVLRLTRAALPDMIERGRGGVINVSSVAAFFSNPSSVTYSATKAWINSFTEGLAIELRSMRSPVRVQALCPGFTRSEFHDAAAIDRGVIPGFLWMSAEEVVDASLRGFARNRLIVIPGRRYRWLVHAGRFFPLRLRQAFMVRYGKRKGLTGK